MGVFFTDHGTSYRHIFKVNAAKATRESLDIMANTFYNRIQNLLAHFPGEDINNILLQTSTTFQPITKNMLKRGEKNGGNTFGIDSSESYYCELPLLSCTYQVG